MPRVAIKIHEFNADAHAARQPLPVIDTIYVEEGPTIGVDDAKKAATAAVERHTGRKIRSISHLKGGGYAAIVPPRAG